MLFSCSVVSDSLQSHELQHARLPCPSASPGVCSNSCQLSWWCHLTISSVSYLLLLPSVFPSIKVFSSELALHIKWPKLELQHQSFQWIFGIDFLYIVHFNYIYFMFPFHSCMFVTFFLFSSISFTKGLSNLLIFLEELFLTVSKLPIF